MSRLDLTAMTWCEPAVLVGLACLVEAEVRRGQYVTVERPKNRGVANYLARMRLGQQLTALGADHNLPVVDERDANTLLELRMFNGSRGAERLARLVDAEVRGIDKDTANALWEGICETGQNVEQHSGLRYGFVAAQVYRATRRSRRRRFMFAVGDSGRGMLETLGTRGATDAADALRMALRPGLSESDDPARGTGLPDINAYLRDLGGGLELVSGNAGLATQPPRRRSWRSQIQFTGTVVQGHIQH
jgi:hypothetical protein